MTDGLFDLPATPELSRAERRIASGEHPLGRIRLHADAATVRGGEGTTCGSCIFLNSYRHHDKKYLKCFLPMVVGGRTTHPRVTHSESTDCRAWWPACTDYQPSEETT